MMQLRNPWERLAVRLSLPMVADTALIIPRKIIGYGYMPFPFHYKIEHVVCASVRGVQQTVFQAKPLSYLARGSSGQRAASRCGHYTLRPGPQFHLYLKDGGYKRKQGLTGKAEPRWKREGVSLEVLS